MNVLVTGGAGFIGSNLVRFLVEAGHDVVVFDNLLSGFRANLAGLGVRHLIIGDIRDASLLQTAMEGREVVFHLAASVGNARSIEHPFLDAEINVIGTLTILELARRLGVRKIVFSSSAGIFGELKTLPICESHPIEPDSPYGATKLCGEKLCLSYAKVHGIEAICLRYFNVFGVNQRYDAYGNVIPIFAHRLIFGQPITIYGDGEQTRDFINVADVANANLLAGLNHGVSGSFNLGSGVAITINHLAQLMQQLSGLRTQVIHGSPRKGDVRNSLADIRAIHEVLGWQPVCNFSEALEKYLYWAKTEFKGTSH